MKTPFATALHQLIYDASTGGTDIEAIVGALRIAETLVLNDLIKSVHEAGIDGMVAPTYPGAVRAYVLAQDAEGDLICLRESTGDDESPIIWAVGVADGVVFPPDFKLGDRISIKDDQVVGIVPDNEPTSTRLDLLLKSGESVSSVWSNYGTATGRDYWTDLKDFMDEDETRFILRSIREGEIAPHYRLIDATVAILHALPSTIVDVTKEMVFEALQETSPTNVIAGAVTDGGTLSAIRRLVNRRELPVPVTVHHIGGQAYINDLSVKVSDEMEDVEVNEDDVEAEHEVHQLGDNLQRKAQEVLNPDKEKGEVKDLPDPFERAIQRREALTQNPNLSVELNNEARRMAQQQTIHDVLHNEAPTPKDPERTTEADNDR